MTDAFPPQGWHPDPTGRHELRWWDGNQWAAQVSDHGVPSSDPLDASGAGSSYGASLGYAPAMRKHPQTTTIFVLGLLSILICGLLAPFAWIMGNNARREVRESNGQYDDDGMLTAGWVMGIVGTALLILGVIVFIIAIVVSASTTTVESTAISSLFA